MTPPSLTDLRRALAAGETSARELLDAALAADRHDAYRHVDPEASRAYANAADAARKAGIDRGPLMGIPVSIKDLYGVPGFPTTGGTAVQLPERFERPGPVVQRAIEQLAVPTGKTRTVELAFGGIGTNPRGTPRNPWDAKEHRVPGGSSAGAGVSLIEGSAALAFGTDTAGSVRIPAAWTGTVGLKTTARRWSTEGIVPLSRTLDTAGILTRTVADAIVAFDALDPRDDSVPERVTAGVRIGRSDGLAWESLSPGVGEAVEQALGELIVAGATQHRLELPFLSEAQELFSIGGPVASELYHFLTTHLPDRLEALDPRVRARIGDAGNLPVHEYLRRIDRLTELNALATDALRDVDVLVMPTVANTPPTVASLEEPGRYAEENLLCLRNTCFASYLGLCALSMPAGKDAAGMPVGLMLMARPFQEAHLLAVARAFERTLGTSAQRLGSP
ncbi:MAG: amidase [Deltaproteobacteria bacterium]|nr:amidase [Deltaproteobacteria bacterium]